MAARAIWKATLRFPGAELPLKLYSAVEDRNIRFHLLHDQDRARVKQKLVDSVTGDAVESNDVEKGYEIERGLFVVLDGSELEELEPKASREISITRFIDAGQIPHQYYDRPYFLSPDGQESDYFAFAAALADQNQAGIAHWVMRKKRYAGALQARDGYLMMLTLRHMEEVVPVTELEPPEGRQLDPKELGLAEQLVAALEDEFDISEFQDEYRERVLELIQAKREGKQLKIQTRPTKASHKSLAESLQASLKSVS